MFFKKKSLSEPQAWGLKLDMHNHLLPGIDDGAADTVATTYLSQGLYQLGFTHAIPSPHIASGLYLNTRQSISEAMAQVDNAVSQTVHISAFAA